MIIPESRNYNLHSHTQFCDGRAPMEVMVAAALEEGMNIYGFTPHSPVCVESGCNMKKEEVPSYLSEYDRLCEIFDDKIRLFKGMEVDFISADFGPHIDYFRKLPLHYIIGSVHFVPNQQGIPLDCDGNTIRFKKYFVEGFENDLRYVVEKYFEQVLTMMERGGFDLLGHFDKIAGNASSVDPDIENYGWYKALIDDVVSHAESTKIPIEINTKSFIDKRRFFPSNRWWEKIIRADVPIIVNSDAHYPEKVNFGRNEAFALLDEAGYSSTVEI